MLSLLLGGAPLLTWLALALAMTGGVPGSTRGGGESPGKGHVGYVSNPGTFPRPLSASDEAHYLQKMREGSMEARNVLVERNLRLVAHIVKKFANTKVETDDLISIGTVGLIKGIDTYKSDRGTRLATYAARCIQNEILMYLRSIRPLHAEVHLHDPIGVDREGNELTLMDVLATDGDAVPDEVGARFDENRVRGQVSCLAGKEKMVLELRYGIGTGIAETQREIARRLGISRSYVSRIEKKALGHLKRELRADLRDDRAEGRRARGSAACFPGRRPVPDALPGR